MSFPFSRKFNAPKRKQAEMRQAQELYSNMVESVTIRPDGIRYTRLKPGISSGAESQPDVWAVGRRERLKGATSL